ncbi:ABC transporter ATP-binding protein/permease, partial [Myxococcota bacterium]|nr:ABC transporter ATP-binding protein/permease [Myxococcota bacterium]
PRPQTDHQEEEELGRAYDGRLLIRLWPYVRPYRRQVWATLLLFLPIFVLELAPAWIVKAGMDLVLPAAGKAASGPAGLPADAISHAFGAEVLHALQAWLAAPPPGVPVAIWLAGVYFVISVALGLLSWLHQVIMATTGQHAMFDLRRAVFAHIQKLPMSFFDVMPVGRLVTRATNDVENLAEMFSQGLVALVTDVIKMLGFAIVLFLVSPKLTLYTFAIVPVMAIAAFVFRWKVREAYRAVRVKIARINTQIQETVTGMKVVQLFSREARNLADFDAMNADHRNAWHQSIRYDSLLFSTIEVAIGITMAVIIGVGTGLAEAGIMYVFIDYMQRFFMPLRDLSAKYSVMQSAMASTERIFELLDTEPRVRDHVDAVPATDPAARGSVEFEHVWFRYGEGDATSDDGDWILRDVSFRVAPGEKVAFVGATGAGKTTIIKLLTRLYDVDRGCVRIDGVDVRAYPQLELRKRVATVLQDVFLFSGSIARNIALGRSDLDARAVERAARAVEAHAFIERLPAGYETEVRERGSNFSTGQRQILSFARALAHGAGVLVLDEATSAIDTETEAAIQRGIRVLMEGKTAIAIAHRLSTIRDVDRIFVLAGGRLVESGSHDTLLAADGVYARLYRLQAERLDLPGEAASVAPPRPAAAG